MEESILIRVSKNELQEMFDRSVLNAVLQRNREIDLENFTIMQLKRKTKRSYGYIKGLIAKGVLKTTADGKFITAQSVKDFFPEGTF